MSRLCSSLDTHKDTDMRLALEPVVKIAQRTRVAVLGIIHVNKSGGTAPLNTAMGSLAFAAVARAVLFVVTDPDDEAVRLLGVPKSNLGRADLPTLAFTIVGAKVADTDDGEIWSSRVEWHDRAQSIREVLEASLETRETRSAVGEACEWLTDHLTRHGGTDESASIMAAGKQAGHSVDSLKRARERLKIAGENTRTKPWRTFWTLPAALLQSEQDSGSKPGESAPTALTAPTGPVSAVGAVGGDPPRDLLPLASCAICAEPLDIVEPGQSTHPGCDRTAA